MTCRTHAVLAATKHSCCSRRRPGREPGIGRTAHSRRPEALPHQSHSRRTSVTGDTQAPSPACTGGRSVLPVPRQDLPLRVRGMSSAHAVRSTSVGTVRAGGGSWCEAWAQPARRVGLRSGREARDRRQTQARGDTSVEAHLFNTSLFGKPGTFSRLSGDPGFGGSRTNPIRSAAAPASELSHRRWRGRVRGGGGGGQAPPRPMGGHPVQGGTVGSDWQRGPAVRGQAACTLTLCQRGLRRPRLLPEAMAPVQVAGSVHSGTAPEAEGVRTGAASAKHACGGAARRTPALPVRALSHAVVPGPRLVPSPLGVTEVF